MARDYKELNTPALLLDRKSQYSKQNAVFENSHKYFLSGLSNSEEAQILLQPGEKLLKRFTIESCLGRGRFATVYLANDDVRSTPVALKVVALACEDVASRAMREIRLNSEILEYKNVIRTYDMHPAMYKGRILLLISMEYAEGGSLRDWLEENRNDFQKRRSDGIDLFLQVCSGVQALHDVGIVHGDLKHENLLRVKGVIKVSDLGLSRNLYETHMTTICRGQHLVVVCGTPAYMSPEQFIATHPDDIDFRSDIYSLGVILFELCHPRCRPPFGGSYEQLQERHLNVPVYLPDGLAVNVSRVISKCLQKNPSKRYHSVSDLMNDLLGYLDQEDYQVHEDTTTQKIIEQVAQLWQNACQSVEEGDLTGCEIIFWHLCCEGIL